MHNDDHIEEDTGDLKNPDVITFYNMTKGAVDAVDEMGESYSVARISNRCRVVIFFPFKYFWNKLNDRVVIDS